MTSKEKIKEFELYLDWIFELDLDGDLNFLVYLKDNNDEIIEKLLELSQESQIMYFATQIRDKYLRNNKKTQHN